MDKIIVPIRLVAMTALVVSAVYMTVKADRCREPDNLESLREELREESLPEHESRYMIPFNMEALIPIHRRRDQDYYTDDEMTCRRLHEITIDNSIDNRSLCPWNYTINRDRKRYPETVTEAVCRCRKCLLFDESRRQTVNTCQPIYYHIRALRRRHGCTEDGYYQYKKVREPIKVGCVCVPPRRNRSRQNSQGPSPNE